jgi:hypothetical protein
MIEPSAPTWSLASTPESTVSTENEQPLIGLVRKARRSRSSYIGSPESYLGGEDSIYACLAWYSCSFLEMSSTEAGSLAALAKAIAF